MNGIPRTNSGEVINILGDNYGALLNGRLPDVNFYVNAACKIVDVLVVQSAKNNPNFLVLDGPPGSGSQAEQIEALIAAHMYSMMDQIRASKGTAGANATFQGQTGMRLEFSKYGQMALLLDMSGTLEALDKRKIAGAAWLGLPVSQQTPYDQRD
jgi:hypothetical protein